jgi:uncharacterized protein YcfL
MKLLILTALSAVLFVSVNGCTTVNTVENAQKSGQTQMIADARAITDGSLARKVSIVGVNQALTPGGLLKVQVGLQNRTRSLQRFVYRFEWFDASGMQINNVISASIPDQIEGLENKYISSIAPRPDCKDFRVKFIEAN